MLTFLKVKNFALIESLELSFTQGFNVLTGETGAGKSILIKALSLLQGQKPSMDFIREQADSAEVQATFSNLSKSLKKLLKDKEIELEEDEIIIKRVISREGSNRVLVNGSVVSIQTLKQIIQECMEICGQHDNQKLLEKSYQLDLVDDFGSLQEKRNQVYDLVKKLSGLRKQRKDLDMDSGSKMQRVDYIKFQVQEIKSAWVSPEEEKSLDEKIKKAQGSKDLTETCNQVQNTLYGEEYSVVSSLERLRNFLKSSTKYEASFGEHEQSIAEIIQSLENVGSYFSRYRKGINADEKSIQAILDKSESIKRLKRKHGENLDLVKEKLTKLQEDLKNLENLEHTLKEIDKQIKVTEDAALKIAKELSEKRKETAAIISKKVSKELQDLNMSGAKFEITIEEGELTSTGINDVSIKIAPNKGEGLKPLDKIASGGELSRIMLALTRTITEKSNISLYVFDEVDAGISGDTGLVVGQKLQEVSLKHQVLCITHLPQVAIYSRQHFLVSKKEQNKRTLSFIDPLDEKGKIEEVARMLGGGIAKKEAVDNAVAMIKAAKTK